MHVSVLRTSINGGNITIGVPVLTDLRTYITAASFFWATTLASKP